ncbi:hypothetical protein PSTG_15553 [Puccinia striiformis f. sp. tritici PST-78]|uniref:Uncharacterized protein n=1 Tax=Puccinia striiformis f. sp. tritici PST-78 TaxID=1165861 RepID=A0A0L0UWC4_9BASI|nr:hypothetical protein PSTG_15553 [Puccinia striiformis f. sp. tritici PST-78]
MLDLALVQRPVIDDLISSYMKTNRASQKGKKRKSKSKKKGKGKSGSGQSQIVEGVQEANDKKTREMEEISNNDWNLFEWIHKLLEKFEQASINTQGEFYATLTMVIPWYKVLQTTAMKTSRNSPNLGVP